MSKVHWRSQEMWEFILNNGLGNWVEYGGDIKKVAVEGLCWSSGRIGFEENWGIDWWGV